MLINNFLECSNNYSKMSRDLFKYHKDEPILDDNGDTADFFRNNAGDLFKIMPKHKENLLPIVILKTLYLKYS